MKPVKIAPIDQEDAELWHLTREVAKLMSGLPWVLVGGVMVRVIEAEHGVRTGWVTGDVDTVLDIRAVSTATEDAAARLQAAAFIPERRDSNLTYRFIRGRDIVDVLGPDHLGGRASLTTAPPDATIEALGSRQALDRRREITIDAGDGPFDVPVPSLVGAIVMKARVAGNVLDQKARHKHERDLARLLALVRDPIQTRSELSPRERSHLRERMAMLDSNHSAWTNIAHAEDGAIALGILIE